MGFEEDLSFEQVDELVAILYKLYGFDFRRYTKSSLKRRILHVCDRNKWDVFTLKNNLINNTTYAETFLCELTVVVSEMFRDPYVFKAIKEQVFPFLETFPNFKIWSAACANGEEAYSIAIMLHESHLLNKAILYGTDINNKSIQNAKDGRFPARNYTLYEQNYQEFGGIQPFANYFDKVDGPTQLRISSNFKSKTVFFNHNLVGDGVFNEFQFILCRNVFIYFEQDLQQLVLEKLYESLCPFGFLCIGNRESLKFNDIASRFIEIDKRARIYQRID